MGRGAAALCPSGRDETFRTVGRLRGVGGRGELVTGRVVYGYVVRRVGRYSKAWYQVRVGCG